jgi:uncharacterized delta-60 repeat protein
MKTRLVLLGALAAASVGACDGLLGINALDGGSGKDAGRPDVAAPDSSPSDDAASDDAASPGSDFAISVGVQQVRVVRGASTQVPVAIAWADGADGNGETVTVTAGGLPTGVAAAPVTVTAPATSGVLTLTAMANATETVSGSLAITGAAGEFSHEVSVPLFVEGLPGTLDDTFGVNGISTVGLLGGTDYAAIGTDGLTTQPDGQIVFCGNGQFAEDKQEIILGRLNVNGGPDPSFGGANGGGGVLIANEPGHVVDVCNAVRVLPSGKLAIAGFTLMPNDPHSAHGFMAGQFKADGTVDEGFGGQGFFSVAIDAVDSKANDFAVEPSGDLVLGGFSGGNLAFLRLSSTGALDLAFGASDAGTSLFPGPTAGAMQVLSSGDVLSSILTSSFLTMQLQSAGSIDSTYGADASATAPAPSPFAGCNGLAIQADGKAVLAGSGGTAGAIQLARFDASGQLDTTFGEQGFVFTTIPGGNASAGAIVMTADGGFAVAAMLPTKTPIGVVRYDATGTLDTRFAGTGYAGIAGTSLGNAITVDSLGRILVGAIARNLAENTASIVVARFWP